MRIQLLMTGSELMRGTTVDTNAVRIADALASIGLAVQRKVTIGDDLDLLVQELRTLSQHSDVLIVNGGLGPTSDDLTAQALATATHTTLTENTIALAHLEQWCNRTKIPLNAANRKQALLPAAAFILDNPVGSAVGFGMHLQHCLVLCTPGVPRELEAMLIDSILPVLQRDYPDCEQQIILRLHMFGIGESQAQDMVDAAIPHWPDGVVLGFRAGLPTVEIKLLARASAANIAHEYFAKLKTLFANYIVAEGEQNLASALLDTLAAQGKTLACAESCTGGLISAMLTEIPGSSRVFTAGFVTYSNSMKTVMLDVSEQTLEKHGAVSEQTVREMVAGTLTHSGADYAVAVSGVAGPDGGTADKPVGTVWIAWGSTTNHGEQRIETQRFLISGPRKRFQQLVAAIALDQVRRQVSGFSNPPPYFQRWQPHSAT
ncbi:MAG TPA: CinA family nicotinamide mononucleotide deamidase-related protein [Pseudomonadales bacterium]|nr:CinA family nicotinamide mononucleotide deamidase-related protein [Pseudomonadales bacterium]